MMRKKFTLALLVLLMVPFAMMAQNVTIKATNGSTIAAVKSGTGQAGDTFFGLGGFATWQHEQLAMVLTVSDGTDLTKNGQLDNPANNLFTAGNYMQIAKGAHPGSTGVAPANVCYVSLSLPSGYRFTGYTIKFTKPKNAQNSEFNTTDGEQSTFGETNSSFATYTTQATIATGGAAQTISRTEMTEGEMSNVLYFKLQEPTRSRALIQLESAEFFFTAEENYSPLTPAGHVSSPVSAVDIPFATSKVDYGTITRRQGYGGSYRISYSSADVKDLEANFVMYEAESVKDGSDFDGVSGKVVDYKSGTISTAGGYFKLGRENQEQIYYIESPSYVELSNGTKNPVGYRIIGAEFEYTKGVSADANVFYITCTMNGTKLYLNTSGYFTTTEVAWEIDNDGYISSNGAYLYYNQGRAATQSTKPDSGERFTIASNGRIYQTEYTNYYIRCYEQNGTYYGLIINNNYGSYATAEDLPPVSVSDYILKIYDKTGANPRTINVTGNGKVSITGLNNDAVKFGVQGVGLVRGTLTLQALDPYLSTMSVVCQDNQQSAIRLSQTFTASDFSVSGGKFHFFLPEESAGHTVAITFEDLKSEYADETYIGGSSAHTSRINFVKSEHYNAFGTSNNKIYNDVSEAANAQKERLKVGIVGTQKFKFNNADDVGTSGGTLTEYPFSLEKYAAAPNNGSFGSMGFTVSASDQWLIRYVFTTDEARYNIAPTTAVQHRAYAFYEMEVHVQTATYSPKVEFKKVYNATCYDDNGDKSDAFYGAVITAVDADGNPGYASTTAIFSLINTAIQRGSDDFGHTDVPGSASKLLYLDFSQLKGVYMITDATHQSMEDFSKTNAANCLIFLPMGSSAPNNNVAYMMESGDFHAANNIILTDKQPFYSPYKIQVGNTNYARYTRAVTWESYGATTKQSLILPFTLAINNGVYSSGSSSFKVTTLSNSDLTDDADKKYVTATFVPVSGSTTKANTPYLIDITSPSDGTFVVEQTGSMIEATTGMSSDYMFYGDAVNAKYTGDGSTHSFKPMGSYSGKIYQDTEFRTSNVFFYYGSKDLFRSSAELSSNYHQLYAYPFRAFYGYSATSGSKLAAFLVNFGDEEISGISENTKRIDFAVQSGKGFLQISSGKDANVHINSLNGMQIVKEQMSAGDTRTINLPAGVYIVNGMKVIVK